MALFGKKKITASKGGESRPEASGRKEKKEEKVTEIKNPKEKKIGLAWHILKRAQITQKSTYAASNNKFSEKVCP